MEFQLQVGFNFGPGMARALRPTWDRSLIDLSSYTKSFRILSSYTIYLCIPSILGDEHLPGHGTDHAVDGAERSAFWIPRCESNLTMRIHDA